MLGRCIFVFAFFQLFIYEEEALQNLHLSKLVEEGMVVPAVHSDGLEDGLGMALPLSNVDYLIP